MATIHAFIKTDYLDKSGEAPLIVEYSHLKKRRRINADIKVDPTLVTVEYNQDTELYKLSGSVSMKREQRGKQGQYNATLKTIQLKLTRVVAELKLKSSSLCPSNVQKEYERENPFQRETSKPVANWTPSSLR